MTASFLHMLRPQPAIEPSLQAADDVPVISSFDLAVLDKGLMVLPEPIAPSALRVMRSTEVLAVVAEASKDLPVERLRTTARSCDPTMASRSLSRRLGRRRVSAGEEQRD